MFDQLVSDIAARFNLATSAVSTLVRGLLSIMTNERTGGSTGFLDLFRHAGLGDVVTSWFGGKEGASITSSQVESALGVSTIETLASSAGISRTVTSSALTALLPKLIGQLTPGGAWPSSGALLSQVSSYLARPAAVPERLASGRAWPRWLPWAALALIALLGWMWLRPAPGTVDPQLTLTNTDGKIAYSGLVRDDATRTAILTALRTTFGETATTGDIRVDRNVKAAEWLPRIGDLFAALRSPGVEFSLDGAAVKLGGWLSAADRQMMTSTLGGIFGPQATIGALADPAAESVRSANERAMAALTALGTSSVTADALVQAMNLTIVNFASGSAEIPADSLEIVRRSAEAITRAPKGTTIEIGGHTDNTGDAGANLTLSQARAEAVRGALVGAGVDQATLISKGYGDTTPRATNDTELGRFQNRRIEYALVR